MLNTPCLPATHYSPVDFTVAFTSTTTITVAGAPFVVADANCYVAFIAYRPNHSTGAYHVLVNGQYSITSAANVITVVGAGAPFQLGDTYIVGIRAMDKAFSAPENAFNQTVLNPENVHYAGSTLFNVTNGADNTYYYYIDLSTYNHISFQFSLHGGNAGAAAGVVATCEGSIQDDGTAAAACLFADITNDMFGVANLTALPNTAATDIWVDDQGAAGGFKWTRIKIVAATIGPDTGDWLAYSKKWYA